MSIKGRLSWIAVDWGSSNVRAWGLDGHGETLETARSDAGMAGLRQEDFEPALLDLVGKWLKPFGAKKQVPIVCCGMVGAQTGWAEAGYKTVPYKPDQLGGFVSAPALDKRLDVRILSGLGQNNPPDVMRGEETQIAGWLCKNPNWSGTLCMPGTHSKWVEVKQSKVLGFSTFITGEMFEILTEHSLLADLSNRSVWSQAAFMQGVEKGYNNPQELTNQLFGLRARSLLEGMQTVHATSEISGLLIGLELRATRKIWQSQQTMLIGAQDLVGHYQAAIKKLGGEVQSVAGEEMALAGLIFAARKMEIIAP